MSLRLVSEVKLVPGPCQSVRESSSIVRRRLPDLRTGARNVFHRCLDVRTKAEKSPGCCRSVRNRATDVRRRMRNVQTSRGNPSDAVLDVATGTGNVSGAWLGGAKGAARPGLTFRAEASGSAAH